MEGNKQYVSHILLLLFNRYLDIALRMNNTRLLSPHIINNYKLKALSWLMGFRLLLLTVYSSRVVANEI